MKTIVHITATILYFGFTQLAAQWKDNSQFTTGTISFDSHPRIDTEYDMVSVRISDLNNDGRNDVICGSFYRNTIYIYYQNANGNLDPFTTFTLVNSTQYIDVGDLNGDDRKDIVIGAFSEKLRIAFQNNDGTFSISTLENSSIGTRGVRIGDLNNDGKNDVAVSLRDSSYFKVYHQSLSGAFETIVQYPCGINTNMDIPIEIGDINQDGLNDVVIGSSPYYRALTIYRQTQNGTMQFHQFIPVPSRIKDFTISDVSGDGRNDITASISNNRPTSFIVVFPQDSAGYFPDVPSFYPSIDIPSAIENADLNNDGRSDIAVLHSGWYVVSFYEQLIDGTFGSRILYGAMHNSYSKDCLAIGDISGDGKKDIVIVGQSGGIQIMINTSP
ncbi:MAG: VCBS repeat-containing protein [Bacteroidota bacterium]|nr:VCBS repeat-containing protein [Bacteroidota bacterium]